MLAFWGSAIFKGCYIYLHDGDKSIKDLCDWIEVKTQDDGYTGFGDYMVFGLMCPIFYLACTAAIVGITQATGMLVPIALSSVLGAFAFLYTLRAVIRLNKKLDKHSSDKDAHK
jgi:hypothetical protein